MSLHLRLKSKVRVSPGGPRKRVPVFASGLEESIGVIFLVVALLFAAVMRWLG